MLYTLNLYSVICQLYLNKTGRKKKSQNLFCQIQTINRLMASSLHSFTYSTNECLQSEDCIYLSIVRSYLRKTLKFVVNFSFFQMLQAIFGGENWLLRTGLFTYYPHLFAVIFRGLHWMKERLFFSPCNCLGESSAVACSSGRFLGYLHLADLCSSGQFESALLVSP